MNKWCFPVVLVLLYSCGGPASEEVGAYEQFSSKFDEITIPGHVFDPLDLDDQILLTGADTTFLEPENTAYPDSLFAMGKWAGPNGRWYFHLANRSERGFEVSLYAQDTVGGLLYKDMQLAYSNCERGSCHQQDAWLEDINADGRCDIVLKYVRSSDNGIVRQEGLVPYYQGEDGVFESNMSNKPDGRLYEMSDVGIKRYDFKASSLLAASKKENISKSYDKYMTEGAYLFPGDIFPTEVSFLFENTNNEVVIDWDKSFHAERIAFGSSGGKWYVGKWLIDDSTTLEELESMNEAPISFYGFDWRYAGQITSWNGGKLEGQGIEMFLEYVSTDPIPSDLTGDQVLTSSEVDKSNIEAASILLSIK